MTKEEMPKMKKNVQVRDIDFLDPKMLKVINDAIVDENEGRVHIQADWFDAQLNIYYPEGNDASLPKRIYDALKAAAKEHSHIEYREKYGWTPNHEKEVVILIGVDDIK